MSGALVSWPVFIAGILLNRRHVSRVTEAQTEKIAELTDAQTEQLRDPGARRPGRHQPGPGGYHGHEVPPP
jgi:hypothetical protein